MKTSMNAMKRRDFMRLMAATAALTAAPSVVRAQGTPRVVVVGGGFGGATAAKYLRLWSGNTIDVTLVDPRPQHTSCIMSNLVLNNRLKLRDLRFSLADLATKYGINLLRDKVEGVDAAGNVLELRGGGRLGYDRLILSPGISFKRVPGLDGKITLNAWIAGQQTRKLRNQIRAMPNGGTFVMTIPPVPYRCPPGPYERACLVADIMVRAGNPGRVVVLDANPDFVVEKEVFGPAFFELYKDVVEYVPDAQLLEVNSPNRIARTTQGEFGGDVLNVIPPHRAARLVRSAGLTDGGDWAGVDPLTYESTLGGYQGIHVIGDSQGLKNLPKSGHHANAQAKVCADAVLRLLAGQPVDTPERIASIVTNSACYSPITYDTATWLTAVYAYDPASNEMRPVQGAFGSAGDWKREHYNDMWDWWANLSRDTFL